MPKNSLEWQLPQSIQSVIMFGFLRVLSAGTAEVFWKFLGVTSQSQCGTKENPLFVSEDDESS